MISILASVSPNKNAWMAELVDALVSKTSGGNSVRVRLPLRAPKNLLIDGLCIFTCPGYNITWKKLLREKTLTAIFYRGCIYRKQKGFKSCVFFFSCTASHALLDAMTNGGLGVAFFSPFDNSRYFLPWRPIQVSPIGISNFLSEWGISVIKNEIIWVGIPCICVIIISAFIRKINRKNSTV